MMLKTSRLSGFGRSLSAAMTTVSRATCASREFSNLMHMSDDALSARGLNRQSIAHYVGAKHFDL